MKNANEPTQPDLVLAKIETPAKEVPPHDKQPPPATAGAEVDIVRFAVQSGAPIETIERMMALQERWQAGIAEKAYFAAMNAVQAEMRPVVKKGFNPQTNSKFERDEEIDELLTPVYCAHGFAISFSEGEAKEAGMTRIVADVMHTGGHHREYHVDLALDDVGIAGKTNKTKVHGKGSTLTYGKRYLKRQIFNLTLTGEDDDGNGGRGNPITPEQAKTLREWCAAAGMNEKQVAAANGALSIEEIPAAKFDAAVAQLKRTYERAKAAKGAAS